MRLQKTKSEVQIRYAILKTLYLEIPKLERFF